MYSPQRSLYGHYSATRYHPYGADSVQCANKQRFTSFNAKKAFGAIRCGSNSVEHKTRAVAANAEVRHQEDRSQRQYEEQDRDKAVDVWPFARMVSVREEIRFDRFHFKFDKSFLDHLKSLKQELTVFVDHNSKTKSRAVGFGPLNNELIDEEEKLLLHKIDESIAKVRNFIRSATDRLEDKEMKKYRRNARRNNCKCGSQVTTSVRTQSLSEVIDTGLDGSGQDAQQVEEKVVLRGERAPLYMHSYLDSLGKRDYSFDKGWLENALAKLNGHVRPDDDNDNEEDSRSQASSQTDSQVMSQCSDNEDDSDLLREIAIPEVCRSNGEAVNEWLDQKSENWDEGYATDDNCSQTQSSVTASQLMAVTSSQKNSARSEQIEIVNRHRWSNTNYSIASGITLKEDPENKVRTQLNRHKQLKFVLKKIQALIKGKNYCTKRDLYYQNVMLFNKSQRVVDEIIDDLACSLRASRTRLHIVSSTRGLVFGHLSFDNTNGVDTDCLSSPNGINIPNDTAKLSRFRSRALFVLVVEKDATFQQLIDLKIHEWYPLIMVTGHGYPDMNTRAFLQILWNTFELPIFGLVDGDAHGLEILCTFRHGSLALSYESANLVVPPIKWLGVMPTDIRDFRLSKEVQIPLNPNDRKKIEDLKQRQYMRCNAQWSRQLDILLANDTKVEIQSLAVHDPSFLFNVYLPTKIRYGKWL